ncbi:MAG: hypothetical protein AAGB26_17875 [Planctomycetota bacterium]
MDEVDLALFEAWDAVSIELEKKPWKLAKRVERASRKELRRPVRAWCVALRASGSRIGAYGGAMICRQTGLCTVKTTC